MSLVWQSASPVLMVPLPKGGWHGEAVTGGFFSCARCNAFVGAGFYPARSSAPLVTDAGRCGHRPLRSSIGEWRCRGRPPGRPAQPCTALLAKTLSLRTSDRFTAVAIRPPPPKILFPSRKKGPRHPAEPLFKPIQFIRNPHCPPCAGAAPHPGCCSLP